MNFNDMRGFIALISVLMLSGVLLLIAATVDLYAYLAHEAAADERSYLEAQQSAFSCARFAVSRLDADPLRFTNIGTTAIQLDDISSCKIVSGTVTNSVANILTQGDSGESSVRIFVTANRASSTALFQLHTWTEY